jgi:hypothetical protein
MKYLLVLIMIFLGNKNFQVKGYAYVGNINDMTIEVGSST